MAKKEEKMYQVKVKVDIPGFRNKFYTGLSVAYNPDMAKDQAMASTLSAMVRNTQVTDIVTSEHITVTKCDLVKQDFFIKPDIS
jgi:hypothetical protein